MNNGMKIAVKILLIVMMPTFCRNGGVIFNWYERGRDEKLQEVQYDLHN